MRLGKRGSVCLWAFFFARQCDMHSAYVYSMHKSRMNLAYIIDPSMFPNICLIMKIQDAKCGFDSGVSTVFYYWQTNQRISLKSMN